MVNDNDSDIHINDFIDKFEFVDVFDLTIKNMAHIGQRKIILSIGDDKYEISIIDKKNLLNKNKNYIYKEYSNHYSLAKKQVVKEDSNKKQVRKKK